MKGYVKYILEKIIFNFYFINWPIPASVWCCIFLLTLLIKIDFLDTKINLLERKKNIEDGCFPVLHKSLLLEIFFAPFFFIQQFKYRVTTIDYNFVVSFEYFILWKTFVQCFISLTFKISLLGNHLFNNRKLIYFLFVNAIR